MHFTCNNVNSSPFWKFSEDLHSICEPLFEQLNVNYFDYTRFYADNTCITLSTDPHYINSLIYMGSYRCAAGRIAAGKHLWNQYIDESFLNATPVNFDYFYGLTFLKPQNDYVELFDFAASRNNASI